MPSLWFVVPVHGRLPLAQICLQQLRHTCDVLATHGIDATAVIVSDKHTLASLRVQRGLGFAGVIRNNDYLGARFNDGIQLATDPAYNPRPADYVVPCGSDDWIDWRLLTALPRHDTMVGFQYLSFVRQDGDEIMAVRVGYTGGCGLRIYPRQLMERTGFRPCEESIKKGCDTSILGQVREANPDMRVQHRRSDPRQIVDWKTDGQNVTPYEQIAERHRGQRQRDPFGLLEDFYPAAALEAMQKHYARLAVAA